MHSLVWLASYPKSGNTWLRALLTQYLAPGNELLSINRLRAGVIASSRDLFDEFAGVGASELTAAEIEQLRPEVYRHYAKTVESPAFMKVHDAYVRTPAGQWLFPEDVTRATIYVIRHPADVAVSLANHSGISIDAAVARVCSDDFVLGRGQHHLPEQLPQRLLSWSAHVRSWCEQTALPVHVVRYEDMLADPHAQFAGVLRACGIPCDEARISMAVDASRFEKLQDEEHRVGFSERPLGAAGPFFRSGRAGGWRDVLRPSHLQQLTEVHGATMRKWSYGVGDSYGD